MRAIEDYQELPEDDFFSEPEFLTGAGPASVERDDAPTGPTFITPEEWNQDRPPRQPDLCPVLNGKPMFYTGESHLLIAPGGQGKSMFLAARAAEILGDGGTVLWLDYESDRLVIIQRLKGLGVTAEEAARFAYWRVDGPLGASRPSVPDSILADFLLKYRPTFTVLDSIARAMNTAGASESSNDDAGEWWQRLVRRQFEMRMLTFVGIHHPGHTAPGTLARGRGASSFEHQLTGGSFVLETVEAFSQGSSGRLRLVVAKDRHGSRKSGTTAAIVDVKVEDCHVKSMDMYLAADGGEFLRGGGQADIAKLAIVKAIRFDKGLTTKEAVYTAVSGMRKATKVEALNALLTEGSIMQDADTKVFTVRPALEPEPRPGQISTYEVF
jgi:hypothetical protein